MELSERLKAAAAMVTKGNVAADIGCDHGYVSIYLVKNGICPKVIAMDVNKGPLEKAKQHICMYNLSDYIETRLSDGLKALKQGEADTMIAAGMGGRLTIKILTESREKVHGMQELILQPQSEIALVRRYLREAGYRIADEAMVLEEGKFYPMMRVLTKDGQEAQTADYEVYDRFGRLLLESKNEVLYEFLKKEQAMYKKIKGELLSVSSKTQKQEKRLLELDRELAVIGRAFAFYEGGTYEVQ